MAEEYTEEEMRDITAAEEESRLGYVEPEYILEDPRADPPGWVRGEDDVAVPESPDGEAIPESPEGDAVPESPEQRRAEAFFRRLELWQATRGTGAYRTREEQHLYLSSRS